MTRRTTLLTRSAVLLVGLCLAMATTGAAVATGQITGVITDGVSGLPLPGVTLEAYTPAGSLAGITSTDGAGLYTLGGLATGSYYVRTRVSATENHVDEIYDGGQCPPCNVGIQIAVTDGVATGGIDFTLEPGGTLTGTVTLEGSGTPLDSMTVVVTTAAGATMKRVVTNGAGVFVATGLPAGSYYARTSASLVQNYVDELYQELPCFPTCAMAFGAPISVWVGSTTSGIDFTLAPGATITGTVTAAAGGAPLAGISVGAYTSTGVFAGSANTSAAGTFTIARLAAGTYFARTELNGQNYESALYHSLPCVGCTVTTGTPIGVSAGGTSGSVDFSLTPGGTMTGTVTEAGTNAPLAAIAIHVFAPNGAFVTRVHTTGAGTFTATGLSTSAYYVRTVSTATQNYLNELYDNLPCVPDSACTVTSGTAVPVAVGATTPGVDFNLGSGGTITGTVFDQASGASVSGVIVGVYNDTGVFMKNTTTANDGSYTIAGLPAGTYYARTAVARGQDFVDMLYNALPCIGACAVTAGTPIAVTIGGAASVDFTLTASGSITGTITAAANGAPLANLTVRAYSASARLLAASATSLPSGAFAITGLAPGAYYVRTENALGLIDELHQGIPCVGGCAFAGGTPIDVGAGLESGGLNFALAAGGRITGHVTDDTSGAPLVGATVAVYLPDGSFVTSAVTDSAGAYLTPTGLVYGTYYARTFNTSGYLNEIYDNQRFCLPNCLVTAGTPIAVTQGAVTAGIDFGLTAGTELIRNGDFANGTTFWSLYATPDTSYIRWQIPSGAFQYYRALPPPGSSGSAVILQPTGAPIAAGAPMLVEFDLANTSTVRKRLSVLVHEGDFSDLSVCTFWLPPNSPRLRYAMQTHGTTAWSNATVSFYAATEGGDGGFYELDNVSLQAPPGPAAARTSCIDPHAPTQVGGPAGPELLLNGDFAGGTTSFWSLYGQIVPQVTAGVFEFYRPAPPEPAGVILQPTGSVLAPGDILTAQFDLGNSSTVRKRVTVLFHDANFSDLSACTFWLAPNQPLSTYSMRSFTTKSWANATISIYAATIGTETWTRLDNVTFGRTPGTPTPGTVCVEPGG